MTDPTRQICARGLMLWAAITLAAMPTDTSAQSSRARPRAEARIVYVGTYTAPDVAPGGSEPSTAEGIYVFEMDPRSGQLTQRQVVPVSNPSFLALTATHLYCVDEDGVGQLSSFGIALDGTLTAGNSVPSEGAAPTHISVHPSGNYVLAANYGTGNVRVVRIAADGSLGQMTDLFQSQSNGTGANQFRQDAAHAHQVLTDPAAQRVFVVDLGADRVNVLNFDPAGGVLTPNEVPFASLASGSGPRHMVFHPSLPRAYVLSELTSTITVFQYDAARGSMIWLQTISTLPSRFSGDNTAGEIRIHPEGRFLYSTNRGHDSVALFEIDETTGKLESNGWESSGGQWPRGMNIDPSGSFLYVANQNTNNIVVFRIQRGGRLSESARVDTPTPVDIEFGAVIRR